MYSPDLGRFLQTDPAGYSSDINLYRYCGNNVVNCTDSSGLTRITYNAGFHVPVSPGLATGYNFGSELVNPLSPTGRLQGTGNKAELVWGEICDIGVSAGFSDFSGTGGAEAGTPIDIHSPLLGKYGGLQITPRKDAVWYNPLTWIDSIQGGLGLGVALPITVTTPLDTTNSNSDTTGLGSDTTGADSSYDNSSFSYGSGDYGSSDYGSSDYGGGDDFGGDYGGDCGGGDW